MILINWDMKFAANSFDNFQPIAAKDKLGNNRPSYEVQ